uniref:Kell metallo-endopeptidase (Kell blood group) n=1 Tax=Pseudonaja textilis TaxID=8673 RepID=A0A670ZPZ2_PSETE
MSDIELAMPTWSHDHKPRPPNKPRPQNRYKGKIIYNSSSHVFPESCTTASCLVLLARLQEAQNGTIDPCEDFFNYACGNWEANNTLDIDIPSVNVFDVLLEENHLIMKKLLEEPQLATNGSAKEKAVRFYTSCMNTDQIEAQGAEPLKKLINEIGGWNITGSWKQTDFNQTLQILMEKYNTFPFFKAYVGPSSSDPSTNIIQVGLLDERFVLQVLRSYYLYLKKLGELMGGHTDSTSTYISLAFSFISNLQKIVTPLKKRQEKRMLFHHTTIKKLQEKAPAIDWLSCLQAAFHPVQLNMSQPIAVHDMDYLKGMSQLIGQWQNRRDVLQTYMILCLVGNLSPALDSQFQKARQELANVLDSRAGNMVRYVLSLYFFSLLTYTSKNERVPMKAIISFAYCDFSPLHFSWEVPSWSVHSYYSLRHHAVVFPAGMFRNPFFHTEFPSAVNFGVMGFFMAHELLHSLYDYVLPENCSTCGLNIPAEDKDCLVKQYGNYSLNGHSINGSFTFLENLADTGGLAIAYQAYEKWFAKHRGVTNLPKLGLSHYQLFFVSFAHAMCGRQSLESLKAFLHKDPHSPPPLRVLGSLSNSQHFSRHFQCPSESPMNPALKCRIW